MTASRFGYSEMDKLVAAKTFFTIYWRYPELLARNYMENAKLLEQWLQVEYERDVKDVQYFPRADAPDICCVCNTILGFCTSGRVRQGCHHCNSTNRAGRGCLDSYFRGQLSKMTGYSYNEVTMWLACCGAIDADFWEARLPSIGFM